jgi:hypothetical protein
MSVVKNVSGVALDVPLLDRVVEVDEVVEVPDFQADGVSPLVWPSVHWEPVTDAPPDPAPAVEPAPAKGAAE